MNTNDSNNFIETIHDVLSFIGYMVDKYGNVYVIGSDKALEESVPEYHHDYFYFCLTKATRSLLASNILADMRFREDAMVLARSAYETYLLIANVINNELFINDSVILSLMLINGDAKYYRQKNGKIDFRKVIIEGVNKPLKYDMSISELSKNTFNKYDYLIHKQLYKYMSEFLHSNFIGAGNYRTDNDKKYDVEPKTVYLDIHFIVMYNTYLLLQSMYQEYHKYNLYLFNQIDENEIFELKCMIDLLKKYLNIILNELNFSMSYPNLKDLILKRINESKE